MVSLGNDVIDRGAFPRLLNLVQGDHSRVGPFERPFFSYGADGKKHKFENRILDRVK